MTGLAATRDIVAIGGSTGSVAVLKELVAGLPAEWPASVFISTHIPPRGAGSLVGLLAAHARLPVVAARDEEPVERGRIYLAGPDRHLLVLGDTIRLGAGPRENMARPAIDALFRSVALSHGPRAIGVVLTGWLNDGASGLAAIKARGGTAVVQDPRDAEADEMPLAALEATTVDRVVAAAELARTLVDLVGTAAGAPGPATDALRLEVEIAADARLGSAHLRRLGTPSPLTCPECQGVLSEILGSHPLRFRCQVGHGFTAEFLAARVDVDEAVRVAMRVMEERVALVERMARDARASGRGAVAEMYEARGEEYQRHALTLRGAAISSLRMGSWRLPGAS